MTEWRWLTCWLGQHETHLVAEAGRLRLGCLYCGWVSAGWDMGKGAS